MKLKDTWNALVGKTDTTDMITKEDSMITTAASDAFPVVRLPKEQLSSYKAIPLEGLAALGTVFAKLPESARTITQTVTKSLTMDAPLFLGIWPDGVSGTMTDRGKGFSGNIFGTTPSGRKGIVGRMRYNFVGDRLPVKETTTTVTPIDPTLMVIAVALMSIEKKLDGIQAGVEEVLRFLKLEKESSQRGNLNMLAEIMEDYKQNCQDERFCLSRIQMVLSIKKDAHKDILFYQGQIAAELQKQKSIHGMKDTQKLLDAVIYQFAEYQLACYLYAYSSFLEVMLHRKFDSAAIKNTIEKMVALSERYHMQYSQCHGEIADYQRSSIESRIIGGIGVATKGLGEAIASVPVIKESRIDEVLIDAGESIGRYNRDAVRRKLKTFETFEVSRMTPFIDDLRSVDLMHNTENALLTDGMNLYMLRPE